MFYILRRLTMKKNLLALVALIGVVTLAGCSFGGSADDADAMSGSTDTGANVEAVVEAEAALDELVEEVEEAVEDAVEEAEEAVANDETTEERAE